jgi:hypothetical protein
VAKVCHSHTYTIPRAALLRWESAAPEPTRFQAAAQPAASGHLTDERRDRLEALIRQFFAGTERRAEVLAEIGRDDAVPREDVARLGEFILFMGPFRGSLGRVIFVCPTVMEKRRAALADIVREVKRRRLVGSHMAVKSKKSSW